MKTVQKIIFTFLMLILAGSVSANEGRISISNGDISCQGISFLSNGQYTVNGRCHGLVYPYEGFYDYYVMWIYKDGSNNPVKLSEVTKGVFGGKIKDRFNQYVITAETGGSPRNPGRTVIVSGSLIPFGGELVPTQVPLPEAPQATESVQEAPTQAATSLVANMSNMQLVLAGLAGIVLLAVVAATFFKRQ